MSVIKCYKCKDVFKVNESLEAINILSENLPMCPKCVKKAKEEHLNARCPMCGKKIGERDWRWVCIDLKLTKVHEYCEK